MCRRLQNTNEGGSSNSKCDDKEIATVHSVKIISPKDLDTEQIFRGRIKATFFT